MSKGNKMYIDAHCHTFNAKDLPISGFLRFVIINSDEKKFYKVLDPFVYLLEKLCESAPGADEENNKLRSYTKLKSTEFISVRAIDYDKDEERRFLENLQNTLNQIKNQPEGDLLLKAMVEDINQPIYSLYSKFSISGIAKKILNYGGVFKRYLQWVRLLNKYRFEITNELIKLYGDGEDGIDIFTPALVDYDHWVKDKTGTALELQIALMEKNILFHKGRVLPYFPFDPWRESLSPNTTDGSLFWLKRAVEENGFIGAKLYPPMGYSSSGNVDLDFKEVGIEDSKKFGEKLDAALNELYQWCNENQVPILVHCNDSQESKKNYGKRANPQYWDTVLQEYPKLRIDLGHFGGMNNLKPQNEVNADNWPDNIGNKMNDKEKNVYADVAMFNEIVDKSRRKIFFNNLEELFLKYPNAPDRLMYGSDLIMLAKEEAAKDYFAVFRDEYKRKFGDSAVQNFLGGNAARFLGLQPGDKTITRLTNFYNKRGIAFPDWKI